MNNKQTGGKPLLSSDWHSRSSQEILAMLDSQSAGLSETQVQSRLKVHGPNRLTPPKRRGWLIRFLLQLHNTLIYVLLVAGIVKALMGHWVDCGVILGVVLINAVIGFIQEGKAESALDAIRNMLSLHATVVRNGERSIVPGEVLVPGDIVLLASGDKVPADLRLLDVRSLRVDESALTGESVPVEKTSSVVAADAPLGDRFCMAFSGTIVAYGSAKGVVVQTGDTTELGRIGSMLGEVQEMSTPLLRQIDGFGRWLTLAILGLSVLTFAVGYGWRNNPLTETFMIAVALAVAAIPEGLPALMTITLALGVQTMARRKAIVRRLPSVETLGSVTVICSDKTGTLTKNEMTVQTVATADRVYAVSGVGYAPEGGFHFEGETLSSEALPEELIEIGRAALLCNDAVLRERDGQWQLEGDPTEGALLSVALKAGIDPVAEIGRLPRADVIPFESEHRFMATMHRSHEGENRVYLKGAPERLLDMCSTQKTGAGTQPLDQAYWQRQIKEMAASGQRMLAIAVGTIAPDRSNLQFADVELGMTLLALFGIIDPPREEAIRAVEKCHRAGIGVKMITGDHAETARVIGEQIGIGHGQPALTGSELEQLDDAALQEVVRHTDVFARASPEHKLRLVQALQANGDITAMTGDGVNDAPALKRADVGLAMGMKGTEAAKEAAEIVLADDNFATIADAVEQGRTIYDNLKKSILFILPTNGGEAMIVVAAILFDLMLPLTSVQILWINMATSVTLGIALAFEATEGEVMERPPRDSKAPFLSGYLVWRICLVSLMIMVGAIGLFMYEVQSGNTIERARTIAVAVVVVAEMAYLVNCRYLYRSSLSFEGFFGNGYVLLSIGVLAGMQLLFTYAPFMQRMFGTASMSAKEWIGVILIGVAVFLVIEVEKFFLRRRLSK